MAYNAHQGNMSNNVPAKRISLPRSISATNLETTNRCRTVIKQDWVSDGPPGGTNFFSTLPAFTLTLPKLEGYPKDFQEFILGRLIDRETQTLLEGEKCLNWCKEATSFVPMYTEGDGNCLLHAASLSMWGFQDRDYTLRKAISTALLNHKETWLHRRWKYNRECENAQTEPPIQLEDSQWKNEWEITISHASLDFVRGGGALQSLDDFHIFVLANVLRRPVFMYASPKLRSQTTGGTLQSMNFHGIYLPLLWDTKSCKKDPLPLAFCGGHYLSLVAIDYPYQYYHGTFVLPVEDFFGQFLPVRYTLKVEDPNALLMDYLNLVQIPCNSSPYVTSTNITCARLTIPTPPAYLSPLIAGFIDACMEVYVSNQSLSQPGTQQYNPEQQARSQPGTQQYNPEQQARSQPGTQQYNPEQQARSQPGTQQYNPEQQARSQPGTQQYNPEQQARSQPGTQQYNPEQQARSQPGTQTYNPKQQARSQPGTQQYNPEQQARSQPGTQQYNPEQQARSQPGTQQYNPEQQARSQPGTQQYNPEQQARSQPGTQQYNPEQQARSQPGTQQYNPQQQARSQPGTQQYNPEQQARSQQWSESQGSQSGTQQYNTQQQGRPQLGSQPYTSQQQPGSQLGTHQYSPQPQSGAQPRMQQYDHQQHGIPQSGSVHLTQSEQSIVSVKCINDCGRYGSPETYGLCPTCYRKQQQEAQGENFQEQPPQVMQNSRMPENYQGSANSRVQDSGNVYSGTIKCTNCSNPGDPKFLGMCGACVNSRTSENLSVSLKGNEESVYEAIPGGVVGQQMQKPLASVAPSLPQRSKQDTKTKCRKPECEFFGTAEHLFYCSKCFEADMENIMQEVDVRKTHPSALHSDTTPITRQAELVNNEPTPKPSQGNQTNPPKCYKCKSFFGSTDYQGLCHGCFMERTKFETQVSAPKLPGAVPYLQPTHVPPSPYQPCNTEGCQGVLNSSGYCHNCNSSHETRFGQQNTAPHYLRCRRTGCNNTPTENGYCASCNVEHSRTYATTQPIPTTTYPEHSSQGSESFRPIPKPRQKRQPSDQGRDVTTAPVVRAMENMTIPDDSVNCFLCNGRQKTLGNNFVCKMHAEEGKRIISSSSSEVQPKPNFGEDNRSRFPYVSDRQVYTQPQVGGYVRPNDAPRVQVGSSQTQQLPQGYSTRVLEQDQQISTQPHIGGFHDRRSPHNTGSRVLEQDQQISTQPHMGGFHDRRSPHNTGSRVLEQDQQISTQPHMGGFHDRRSPHNTGSRVLEQDQQISTQPHMGGFHDRRSPHNTGSRVLEQDQQISTQPHMGGFHDRRSPHNTSNHQYGQDGQGIYRGKSEQRPNLSRGSNGDSRAPVWESHNQGNPQQSHNIHYPPSVQHPVHTQTAPRYVNAGQSPNLFGDREQSHVQPNYATSREGGATGTSQGDSGKPTEFICKVLCATPGCSFKGYPELDKLCPDCYEEAYPGKKPPDAFPLV